MSWRLAAQVRCCLLPAQTAFSDVASALVAVSAGGERIPFEMQTISEFLHISERRALGKPEH